MQVVDQVEFALEHVTRRGEFAQWTTLGVKPTSAMETAFPQKNINRLQPHPTSS
jgi:hypothetical protein